MKNYSVTLYDRQRMTVYPDQQTRVIARVPNMHLWRIHIDKPTASVYIGYKKDDTALWKLVAPADTNGDFDLGSTLPDEVWAFNGEIFNVSIYYEIWVKEYHDNHVDQGGVFLYDHDIVSFNGDRWYTVFNAPPNMVMWRILNEDGYKNGTKKYFDPSGTSLSFEYKATTEFTLNAKADTTTVFSMEMTRPLAVYIKGSTVRRRADSKYVCYYEIWAETPIEERM